MSNLKKSIFINAPMEKVAKYGTNPKEWGHWYAHLSDPENLVGEGEAGTVGEFKYTMLGMHLPMKVEVIENTQSPEKHVWMGTFEGPLSGKQTFTYIAKDGGTEVDVDIEYTVPGSILGRIADILIIEKIQENATVATLENLKAICESA
ncbi:SRPBCC family protein [Alkalibacter mobilis]|uniref:SRPBCC family protein n=1 Tax=Alkalibacter mobilis TaxID=2787712 RepID=UPI00189D3439|nr:SRPBCC family protein [Alkalibacter mobilis]